MPKSSILLLALGKEILGDNLAPAATGELKEMFEKKIDVLEAPEIGSEMLDALEGYEAVLVLDTLNAGCRPGTVLEFSTESAPAVLPESLSVLKQLGKLCPKRVTVLSLVAPGIRPESERSPAFLVTRGKGILEAWLDLM